MFYQTVSWDKLIKILFEDVALIFFEDDELILFEDDELKSALFHVVINRNTKVIKYLHIYAIIVKFIAAAIFYIKNICKNTFKFDVNTDPCQIIARK